MTKTMIVIGLLALVLVTRHGMPVHPGDPGGAPALERVVGHSTPDPARKG